MQPSAWSASLLGGSVGAIGGTVISFIWWTIWFKGQPIPPTEIRNRIILYGVWTALVFAASGMMTGGLIYSLLHVQARGLLITLRAALLGCVGGGISGAIIGFGATLVACIILRVNGQAIVGAIAIGLVGGLGSGILGIVIGILVIRLLKGG